MFFNSGRAWIISAVMRWNPLGISLSVIVRWYIFIAGKLHYSFWDVKSKNEERAGIFFRSRGAVVEINIQPDGRSRSGERGKVFYVNNADSFWREVVS
jgi:hypothetical protein